MSNVLEIKEISAKKTHAVRHPMLRQGRPIEDCVFQGDEDKTTVHLGAFEGKELVGVVSAYQKTCQDEGQSKAYQVRGVAVLEEHQRKGIGRELMAQIEVVLRKKNATVIWLNARATAFEFYTSLHYIQKGDPFDLPLIGTHYYFYKELC